jgi:imidazolonepropionase-like amidohydrolase
MGVRIRKVAFIGMLVSLRVPGAADRRQLAVDSGGRWIEPAVEGGADVGEGMWALPGLVDAHAHLAADTLELAGGDPVAIRRRAFACLEGGTFLIVDKGWSDTTVVATLTDCAPGDGPDFEGAGRIIAVPDGYYPGFGVETDIAGLKVAVAEAVVEGRGWVKLIGDWPQRGRGAVANFDEAALESAVDVAHRGGAQVAIHTMAREVPSAAVRAGVDSIEHGLFLTEADLEALGLRGGAWVPTILRMEAIVELLGDDSSGGRLVAEGIDNVRGLLPGVPEGVAVLAGTDLATPSSRVGHEVAALVESGLAADRAVGAASSVARRYLDRSEGFQPGHPADAVFYAVDPVEDPTVLVRPALVMRSGRIRR